MKKNKKYAVLALPVAHSRSPDLFKQLAPENASYSRIHIRNQAEIVFFLKELDLDGFNVSAPWKRSASDIFASPVSNIFVKSGKSYAAFNTDILAVKHVLENNNFDKKTKCLLIGAGGAAFAVLSALNIIGLTTVNICNRTNESAKILANKFGCNHINFSDLNENIKSSELIISTLPTNSYNFERKYFNKSQILFDANYNDSALEKIAKQAECKFISGQEWLKWQASFGFEIFLNKKVNLTDLPEKRKKVKNILLIGFMGAGKTSVGKMLAKKLGRKFIDLDAFIEKNEGATISDIFKNEGEEYFRKLEKKALSFFCKNEEQIIASGGGIIESYENVKIIKESCFVVYLYSDIKTLWNRVKNSQRPLAKDFVKFSDLFNIRKDKYFSASDLIILHNDAQQTSKDLDYEIRNARIFEG